MSFGALVDINRDSNKFKETSMFYPETYGTGSEKG